MNTFYKLLFGAALIPASLSAHEAADSIADTREKLLELDEVVVVARRPVVRQQDGKLVYLVKNDPYAKGLDGIAILDRIPRVSVSNGRVSVAGKGTVRYIIDGVLLELDARALAMRLQNLRAEDIEKIELLATPPPRYAAEPNAAYISITTRNETLGTRGSVYGSLNQGINPGNLREYISGSISHTTRRVEMSLDASLSDYRAASDNDIEYTFSDGSDSRRSLTHTRNRLLTAGFNALFRYKISAGMSLGAIANYNYSYTSADATNETLYGSSSSSSLSNTKSRPNNALTLTGFYDWTFGTGGESVQLTYNHFRRHSPTRQDIVTTFSGDPAPVGILEKGATDYRFHSASADLRIPRPWAQLEAGVSYTDIMNSSDCLTLSGESRLSDVFDYTERVAAVYATASRELGKGWRAKLGLRYEYTWTSASSPAQTDSYGHLFPTFTLTWNPGRVGSFNAAYSAGIGRPNLWELNPFRYYTAADEYAAGNPALRPTLYHNAEISYYGLGGLYAVVYTSFASDAIGYIRSFDADGAVSTTPRNCLSTNKTGLYANYRRSIFDRWEIKGGGEVFRSQARSDAAGFSPEREADWSGKLEMSTSVMLNRQKTLIFGAQFTHFFPWQQNMVTYSSFQLFNLSLRYSMSGNRLNMQLTVNDIFGWNKTRSRERYADYVMRQTFDAHTAYVLFGISYRFGRDKVAGVWRDSRERQSGRTK